MRKGIGSQGRYPSGPFFLRGRSVGAKLSGEGLFRLSQTPQLGILDRFVNAKEIAREERVPIRVNPQVIFSQSSRLHVRTLHWCPNATFPRPGPDETRADACRRSSPTPSGAMNSSMVHRGKAVQKTTAYLYGFIIRLLSFGLSADPHFRTFNTPWDSSTASQVTSPALRRRSKA